MGRGPRAFQIGKISMVNPLIEKFVKVHNYGIFDQLAITHSHYIAIEEKIRCNRLSPCTLCGECCD